MTFEQDQIDEISEILEMLLEEDLSSKIQTSIQDVLSQVNYDLDVQGLLKIQDELEHISNMNNLNEFCRTEIMNLITSIETFVNA